MLPDCASTPTALSEGKRHVAQIRAGLRRISSNSSRRFDLIVASVQRWQIAARIELNANAGCWVSKSRNRSKIQDMFALSSCESRDDISTFCGLALRRIFNPAFYRRRVPTLSSEISQGYNLTRRNIRIYERDISDSLVIVMFCR